MFTFKTIQTREAQKKHDLIASVLGKYGGAVPTCVSHILFFLLFNYVLPFRKTNNRNTNVYE